MLWLPSSNKTWCLLDFFQSYSTSVPFKHSYCSIWLPFKPIAFLIYFLSKQLFSYLTSFQTRLLSYLASFPPILLSLFGLEASIADSLRDCWSDRSHRRGCRCIQSNPFPVARGKVQDTSIQSWNGFFLVFLLRESQNLKETQNTKKKSEAKKQNNVAIVQ